MGTHIIWRNPSPPRRAGFKLRRVAGNERTTTYQVSGRIYQRPFQLLRGNAGLAPGRTVGARLVAPASELVLARW